MYGRCVSKMDMCVSVYGGMMHVVCLVVVSKMDVRVSCCCV